MKKDLVPVDIELIHSLNGWEREEAIKKYHEWIEEQRKKDKKQKIDLVKTIYRFKNKESINNYKKIWRQRVRRRNELKKLGIKCRTVYVENVGNRIIKLISDVEGEILADGRRVETQLRNENWVLKR